jgi:hypothetical protein
MGLRSLRPIPPGDPRRIGLGYFLAQLLYFANYYSLFFDPGNSGQLRPTA